MKDWVRPVFLFTVLGVWVVGMSISFAQLQLPEPILWGVPTSLWLAMFPPTLPWRKPTTVASEEKPGA